MVFAEEQEGCPGCPRVSRSLEILLPLQVTGNPGSAAPRTQPGTQHSFWNVLGSELSLGYSKLAEEWRKRAWAACCGLA